MHEPMDVRPGGERREELMREAKMVRQAREAAGDREQSAGRGLKRLYGRLRRGFGSGKGRHPDEGRP